MEKPIYGKYTFNTQWFEYAIKKTKNEIRNKKLLRRLRNRRITTTHTNRP